MSRAFEKNVLNTTQRNDTGSDCPICLRGFEHNSHYVRCTTCLQPCHVECVRLWFESGIGRRNVGKCPLCQAATGLLDRPEFVVGSRGGGGAPLRAFPVPQMQLEFDSIGFAFWCVMVHAVGYGGMRDGVFTPQQGLLLELGLILLATRFCYSTPLRRRRGGGNKNNTKTNTKTANRLAKMMLKALPYYTTPLKTKMTIDEIRNLTEAEALALLKQMGISEEILETNEINEINRTNVINRKISTLRMGGKRRVRTRKYRA